jgi:uncharacterized membrane protein YheB (UPF0754 family)
MNSQLLVYLGLPLIAALIGYFTNWVAIKMLFRPHTEKRILGVKIPFTPGLIPSRRGELAEKTGSIIARHLVNEDSIGARFDAPAVREKFDSIISGYIDELLKRDFDSIEQFIPEKFHSDWLALIARLKLKIQEQIVKILSDPTTENILREHLSAHITEWFNRPINELLPAETLDSVPKQLADWIASMTETDSFEERVRQFVEQKADSLLEDNKQLADYVPGAIKESAYEKIQTFMPFMLEKVGAVLEDENLKKRIKISLYEWVDKTLGETFDEGSAWDQLKFGLMETFLMSTEEIKLKLDQAVEEAAPRFALLLKQEEVQTRVYNALVGSVDGFLEKSIADFNLRSETIDKTKEEITNAIIGIARSKKLRDELVEVTQSKLEEVSGKSLLEIFPDLDLDQLSLQVNRRVVELVKSETTTKALADFISDQLDEQLRAPVGKLERFVPAEFIPKSKTWASETVLNLFKRETPKVVAALDVETLVRDRVEALPLPEMERLVMEISNRQLRAITWFGALLGFLIGLVQVIVILAQGGLGS